MMAVMNRRQEYKELTRAALLSAAAEQFADGGFAASGVDDIALAARVSKGTVYHHFADKADLFEAVFRKRQQQLLTEVTRATRRHLDPWARLDAALSAYLRRAIADPAHRRLLQEAPVALGAQRCRDIDQELAIPAILAALTALDDAGELAQPATGMLARVLFAPTPPAPGAKQRRRYAPSRQDSADHRTTRRPCLTKISYATTVGSAIDLLARAYALNSAKSCGNQRRPTVTRSEVPAASAHARPHDSEPGLDHLRSPSRCGIRGAP
jgi:AcrR family transcriptional regulator